MVSWAADAAVVYSGARGGRAVHRAGRWRHPQVRQPAACTRRPGQLGLAAAALASLRQAPASVSPLPDSPLGTLKPSAPAPAPMRGAPALQACAACGAAAAHVGHAVVPLDPWGHLQQRAAQRRDDDRCLPPTESQAGCLQPAARQARSQAAQAYSTARDAGLQPAMEACSSLASLAVTGAYSCCRRWPEPSGLRHMRIGACSQAASPSLWGRPSTPCLGRTAYATSSSPSFSTSGKLSSHGPGPRQRLSTRAGAEPRVAHREHQGWLKERFHWSVDEEDPQEPRSRLQEHWWAPEVRAPAALREHHSRSLCCPE